jgi:hypothetical protein
MNLHSLASAVNMTPIVAVGIKITRRSMSAPVRAAVDGRLRGQDDG